MQFLHFGLRTILSAACVAGLFMLGLATVPAEAAVHGAGAPDLSMLGSLAFGGLIITPDSLRSLFISFSAAFREGFDSSTSHWQTLAMKASSDSKDGVYGWLGKIPMIREWIGSRIVHNLMAHGYTITNRKFELTVEVPREEIEDDKLGIYGPVFKEMGLNTRQHPDQLLFELMLSGFTELCYDGQPMFDTEHPVIQADTSVASVSNVQAGAKDPWFLLDLSRAIKPFIFQERMPYRLTTVDRDDDERVFMEDTYLYGIRARANVGFGLWQLAFASTDDLTAANYRDARKAMMQFKGDNGQPLNIRPTHLVVGPGNEEAALKIVNAMVGDAGASNVWAKTAELVVATQLP